MKRYLSTLTGILALAMTPFALNAQTYVAQSGVTLAVGQAATATYTSGAVRLPNFNAAGVLTVVEAGITGSPSGCTEKLYFQTNAGGSTGVISTTNITPSTGTQTFTITPSIAAGDNIYLVYACSSTYPTAGTFTITLSPSAGVVSISGTPAVTLTSGTLTTITNAVTVNQANVAGTNDPCNNMAIIKTGAVINVASAGEASIVALSAGKAIYVCAFIDASAGTTPSITFQQGTVAGCASGTTAITGTMPFTSGSSISANGGGGTLFSAPAGDVLCALTVGANHGGVLAYVQQ